MATTVDLGKVRPVWKGTWSGSTAYEVHDMVKNGVNSYICTTAHTSDASTFSNDSANWDDLAVGADIPSQTGNAGEYLTTDGSNLSWGAVSGYTDTDAKTLFNANNAAPVYAVRAWGNFRGGRSNSVGINASGNISSFSRSGTGKYTANFSTALPNSNYSVAGAADYGQTTSAHYFQIGDRDSGDTYSTGAIQFGTYYSDGNDNQDVDKVTLIVVG